MVVVGSAFAAPKVGVNILGSMADDGVRCALKNVGVTLAGSLDVGILVGSSLAVAAVVVDYPAPN
jgi:hypothetical protein